MIATNLKKLTFAMTAALIVVLLIFALAGVSAYARATDEYEGELILETSLTTTAEEVEPGTGVYRTIAAGDTFTVTYKLVKNDGMVEAAFTPSYDKDAFELTSFAVDTDHWSLFDEYDTMTAAEFIADRNQKYAAGEIENFRLTFLISYDDVRDPNGTLSDEFITIVYTARADLAAPAAAANYAFGFDTTTMDGFFTNAAKSGDKLLSLKLKVGEEQGEPVTEPLGADTFSFDMRAPLSISVDAYQTVSFRYDEQGGTYYVDPTDILYTIADNNGEAFFSDPNAVIQYTFYKKNTETGDLEPIVNEQTGEPALPSEPDLVNTYVVVTARGNAHFDEAVSEPMQVAIAPIYLDVPNLRIYDNQHGETYATINPTTLVATATVTFGTSSFSVKEVVAGEEVDYEMPSFANESATGYNYTYLYSQGGMPPYSTEGNPLNGVTQCAGVHTVKISTPDPTFVKFAGTELSDVTIRLVVNKATIYLDAHLREDAESIYYGDDAPTSDKFYVTMRGILETGAFHDQLVEIIEEYSCIHSDAPYTRYSANTFQSNKGEYHYYALCSAIPQNYTVVRGEDAVLTVAARPLTVSATYNGNKVTFSGEGIMNFDGWVSYKFFVSRNGVELDSGVVSVDDTYTAHYADVGTTLVVTVKPYPVNNEHSLNYAAGSLTLNPVYHVFFQGGEGFSPTGVFTGQDRFSGEFATRPGVDPTCPGYEFAGWTVGGELFDFENTPITENTTIVASWVRSSGDFKFRAVNASADLLTGASYALTWDEQNEKFVIATTVDPVSGDPVPAETADSATFSVGAAIPTKVEIKGFYVKKWWRVIPQQVGDPTVTAVSTFDESAALDVADGAYYLAEMVLNIGNGDVNGDGIVSVFDLLSMKRYLVGTTIGELRTEQDAWDAALRDDSNGDWFYPEKWDVNGDGSNDTRDIVALREALATGYNRVILTDWTAGDEYCPGQQIASAVVVNDATALAAAIEASTPVILGSDVAFESLDQTALDVDVYIDLGGHTVTADAWTIETSGSLIVFDGRLTVKEVSFVGENAEADVLDYYGETYVGHQGAAWSVTP